MEPLQEQASQAALRAGSQTFSKAAPQGGSQSHAGTADLVVPQTVAHISPDAVACVVVQVSSRIGARVVALRICREDKPPTQEHTCSILTLMVKLDPVF